MTWRRFLAIALPPGLVLIWVLAINGALTAAESASQMGWLPDRQTGAGYVDDNRQRAQAAEREYRLGRVPRDAYLAVLFGISNVREGVQLDVLNPYLGTRVKLLGQAGAGAGAPSILENATPLLATQLKPDLALIGLSPLQMLDPPPLPVAVGAPSNQREAKDELKRWLGSTMWLFARRIDLVIAADRTLQVARARFFSTLDVALPVADVRSPWRPMMRTLFIERVPDAAIKSSLANLEPLGPSKVSRYVESSRSARMLASMILQLQARGSKVVVFLTPEHSLLRHREPANVTELIQAKLRSETGDPSIVVMDFRSAIDDSGFVDLVHLNTRGSRDFSRVLGKAIGQVNYSRAPLMATVQRPQA